MKNIHFSSQTNEWATPQEFYDELNKEFNFNLDPCATKENAKCKRFFTKEQDGLKQDWGNMLKSAITGKPDVRVFCNPPYGREISKWVEKAYFESRCCGALVVMLIPARTDTKYFHKYIYNKKNVEIRFLKGRLKFGGATNSAPFPSMLIIFKN